MNDNKLHAMVRKSLDKDVEALGAELQSRLAFARADAMKGRLEASHDKFSVLSLFLARPARMAMVFASLTFVAVSSFSLIDVSEEGKIKVIQETLTENEPLGFGIVNDEVGKDFFLTEEDLDFFDNLELYEWLDSEFQTS